MLSKSLVQLLAFILLSYTANNQAAGQADERIVGGYEATIISVPYLVNIRRNGYFKCGGTLVTPRHVVTAAHCIKNYTAESFLVTAGATSLASEGQQRNVDLIAKPSRYSSSTYHMDVAVLRLDAPVELNGNVSTIDICNVPLPVGAYSKVSGWGLTAEDGSVANRVRSVDVPIVSLEKCAKDYADEAIITNSMFCAAEPGTKDSCSGDSGGPLVYNNQLCGIVSWGIGCAQALYPGVYTSVRAVRSFITAVLQQFP
ncbi:hypodermin-A-like [Musca autumnalis]|uniref:hypodermin-A-like n=1 Tax=Musca autumnalis TaxID=221902 RepID=UPI003CF06832